MRQSQAGWEWLLEVTAAIFSINNRIITISFDLILKKKKDGEGKGIYSRTHNWWSSITEQNGVHQVLLSSALSSFHVTT